MHPAHAHQTGRAGYFSNVASADDAVRRLLRAGFAKDEIAVICPDEFKSEFHPQVGEATPPGTAAMPAIAGGGMVGATLGGLALAATTIATGTAPLLAAASVLVGGGALAGSFGGLIVRDGYSKGVGEHYEQAVQMGKIVVGVELQGEHAAERTDEAARILTESGADFLTPLAS